MGPIGEAGQAGNDARPSTFTAADVEAIACRRGWLPATLAANRRENAAQEVSDAFRQWMSEAAQLLGAQADDLPALERLLECIFSYDAAQLVTRVENQAVLSREGARDVLRELAIRVLDTPAVDSDRFKETTGRRGPELFHPVRLALAGRTGEGEFDRVILLLDGAARLSWAVPVKNCRQRILEFCSALD